MLENSGTGFTQLGLNPKVAEAITQAGFSNPTDIQTKAIPQVLDGKDVVGLAQTGTGKTAAFLLPMIELLSRRSGRAMMPRGLILSPTRELAAQISEQFTLFAKNKFPLKAALIMGGVSMSAQLKALRNNLDVIICTPGRLLDFIDRGKILMGGIEMVVIDEADRMLDMGFIPDIEKIFSLLGQRRQTLIFSATMPKPIKLLANRFMNDPVEIAVDRPSSTAKTVEQVLVKVHPKSKLAAIRGLLKQEDPTAALIFCNRKRDVDRLTKQITGDGVARLHGDLSQNVRTRTLNKFRSGEVNILVASDVAARGLDVNGLSHVFNFDPPKTTDDYVHRIGRTGRAGRMGRAITLVSEDFNKLYNSLKKKTNSDNITVIEWESQAGDEEETLRDKPRGRGKPPARSSDRSSGRSAGKPYGASRGENREGRYNPEDRSEGRASRGEGRYAREGREGREGREDRGSSRGENREGRYSREGRGEGRYSREGRGEGRYSRDSRTDNREGRGEGRYSREGRQDRGENRESRGDGRYNREDSRGSSRGDGRYSREGSRGSSRDEGRYNHEGRADNRGAGRGDSRGEGRYGREDSRGSSRGEGRYSREGRQDRGENREGRGEGRYGREGRSDNRQDSRSAPYRDRRQTRSADDGKASRWSDYKSDYKSDSRSDYKSDYRSGKGRAESRDSRENREARGEKRSSGRDDRKRSSSRQADDGNKFSHDDRKTNGGSGGKYGTSNRVTPRRGETKEGVVAAAGTEVKPEVSASELPDFLK